MTLVRLILVLLYLGALYLRHARRRQAEASDAPKISPWKRPWNVLTGLWGPGLWVFPGVLWIGLLGLPPVYTLVLCFLLPLTLILLLLLVMGVFSFAGSLPYRLVSFSGAVVVFLVTGLVLLFAFIKYDLSPVTFGLFLFSVGVPPLISMALLTVFTPDVIPLNPGTARPTGRALSIILGHLTGAPKSSWVVEDGKIQLRIKGSPGMGAGPGVLLTEPENVVVLQKGGKLSRVAGPGVVLLERMEVPLRVVDLRNQLRSTRVDALTRDGIEVSVPISSHFRIKRGRDKVTLGRAWPHHNQSDVFRAVFAEEVDPSGRSPMDARTSHPWEDRPIKVAAHKLEHAVSFYTLDQLYSGVVDPEVALKIGGPGAELVQTHHKVASALQVSAPMPLGDPLARSTIGKLVREAVRKDVAKQGYDILGGGVGDIVKPLDHSVIDQRIEVWRSRLTTSVEDWRADIERSRYADYERLQQASREKVLKEMVEKTNQLLASADSDTRRSFVAYHMLDSLLRIASEPEVRKMLPSALPAFQQLSQQLRTTLQKETGR